MLPCLPKTCLVVPCYNEADRIEPAAFVEFAARNPTVSFCFVDDGSRDATGAVLRDLVTVLGDRGQVVSYAQNTGKAHAVRLGVLQALSDSEVDYVGYWDADLATPLDELLTLFDRAGSAAEVICASRWQRMGANIQRRWKRHLSGRVFATLAALTLGRPFYDTQCGAKLFRAPLASAVFAEPFIGKWIFDVEVLIRACEHPRPSGVSEPVVEVPLTNWHDVPGSKLTSRQVVRAMFDLLRIYWAYRARRSGIDHAEKASTAGASPATEHQAA